MILNFVIILMTVGNKYPVRSEDVEVVTTFGQLRGIKSLINDGRDAVYQFKNIPFAAPPVGALRFQKPVPHPPLSGVYNATEFGPACVQTFGSFKPANLTTTEDCLNLNIYVPHYIGSAPRPVMVWVYGGGYLFGAGKLYDASYLATVGDVIVVTFNYRMGLFGFFSTEDKRYPGNYGLWDTLEAIRWTKSHIRSFGGDPDKITIFGESAGALLAADLMVSPLSKGLFQRVILESGGDFRAEGFDREMKKTSIRALKYLGCMKANETQIAYEAIRCILKIDSNKIHNATEYIRHNSVVAIPIVKGLIGPVIDGELSVDIPEKQLKNISSAESTVFNSVDLMMGINSAEGGLFIGVLDDYQNQFNFSIKRGIPKSVLCQVVAKSLADQYYHSNDEVKKVMCGAYTTLADPAEQGRATLNLLRDWMFAAPTKSILDTHAKSSRHTYEYLFSKPSVSKWLPPWFSGANHAEDLYYIFGRKAFNKKSSESEIRLANRIMRYWTNFAKTGNPNKAGSHDPFWPSYKSRRAYIQLDDHVTSRHDLLAQDLVVHLETIPQLMANYRHVDQLFG